MKGYPNTSQSSPIENREHSQMNGSAYAAQSVSYPHNGVNTGHFIDYENMEESLRRSLTYNGDAKTDTRPQMHVSKDAISKFRNHINAVERENVALKRQILRIASSHNANSSEVVANESYQDAERMQLEDIRSACMLLSERIKRMEEQNKLLHANAEKQRYEYERYLDRVSSQVFQALSCQQRLQMECDALRMQVLQVTGNQAVLSTSSSPGLPYNWTPDESNQNRNSNSNDFAEAYAAATQGNHPFAPYPVIHAQNQAQTSQSAPIQQRVNINEEGAHQRQFLFNHSHNPSNSYNGNRGYNVPTHNANSHVPAYYYNPQFGGQLAMQELPMARSPPLLAIPESVEPINTPSEADTFRQRLIASDTVSLQDDHSIGRGSRSRERQISGNRNKVSRSRSFDDHYSSTSRLGGPARPHQSASPRRSQTYNDHLSCQQIPASSHHQNENNVFMVMNREEGSKISFHGRPPGFHASDTQVHMLHQKSLPQSSAVYPQGHFSVENSKTQSENTLYSTQQVESVNENTLNYSNAHLNQSIESSQHRPFPQSTSLPVHDDHRTDHGIKTANFSRGALQRSFRILRTQDKISEQRRTRDDVWLLRNGRPNEISSQKIALSSSASGSNTKHTNVKDLPPPPPPPPDNIVAKDSNEPDCSSRHQAVEQINVREGRRTASFERASYGAACRKSQSLDYLPTDIYKTNSSLSKKSNFVQNSNSLEYRSQKDKLALAIARAVEENHSLEDSSRTGVPTEQKTSYVPTFAKKNTSSTNTNMSKKNTPSSPQIPTRSHSSSSRTSSAGNAIGSVASNISCQDLSNKGSLSSCGTSISSTTFSHPNLVNLSKGGVVSSSAENIYHNNERLASINPNSVDKKSPIQKIPQYSAINKQKETFSSKNKAQNSPKVTRKDLNTGESKKMHEAGSKKKGGGQKSFVSIMKSKFGKNSTNNNKRQTNMPEHENAPSSIDPRTLSLEPNAALPTRTKKAGRKSSQEDTIGRKLSNPFLNTPAQNFIAPSNAPATKVKSNGNKKFLGRHNSKKHKGYKFGGFEDTDEYNKQSFGRVELIPIEKGNILEHDHQELDNALGEDEIVWQNCGDTSVLVVDIVDQTNSVEENQTITRQHDYENVNIKVPSKAPKGFRKRNVPQYENVGITQLDEENVKSHDYNQDSQNGKRADIRNNTTSRKNVVDNREYVWNVETTGCPKKDVTANTQMQGQRSIEEQDSDIVPRPHKSNKNVYEEVFINPDAEEEINQKDNYLEDIVHKYNDSDYPNVKSGSEVIHETSNSDISEQAEKSDASLNASLRSSNSDKSSRISDLANSRKHQNIGSSGISPRSKIKPIPSIPKSSDIAKYKRQVSEASTNDVSDTGLLESNRTDKNILESRVPDSPSELYIDLSKNINSVQSKCASRKHSVPIASRLQPPQRLPKPGKGISNIRKPQFGMASVSRENCVHKKPDDECLDLRIQRKPTKLAPLNYGPPVSSKTNNTQMPFSKIPSTRKSKELRKMS
uniref:uncharacterized protein LOC120328755 isoform X2 n=1 Tax=Styela clava TaxID=7725 RepID=UPI00193951BE|nr:uncharacterized protein LOC120328755 isoform X2 [Styela clava]